MCYYKFTLLDETNAFHCGFEFYSTYVHIRSHVPTSTNYQSMVKQLPSLNLVLYNVSHHLILNKM